MYVLIYLILNVVFVMVINLTTIVASVSILYVITEVVGGVMLNTYMLSVTILSNNADCLP
jgi:hypothetical protein